MNFLSLDVRDDRDTVRDLVREHGWKMPVGYDRDGAVANLYRVGGCPTFAYAYPGGTLQSASIGELTPASSTPGRRPAGRDPRRGGGDEMAAGAAERGWAGSPLRGRAGSRPTSPPSSPASGSPGSRSTAAPARSPEPVRRRLRDLSDRFYGGHAIHMRERPIPWAYRVFFRQIGLDPDRTRTPVEQLALERITTAPSRAAASRRRADDRDVETGVALRAFDAERLEGGLGIRDSAPGESLEGRPGELPQGTLVIADERGPVGAALRRHRRGPRVDRGSRRIAIAAVQVKGVPQIAVERRCGWRRRCSRRLARACLNRLGLRCLDA